MEDLTVQNEFWCFLGIEQGNLRRMFDGFFRGQNTYAYFLHPEPGANVQAEINSMFRQMEKRLPQCQVYFILYARVYELYGDDLLHALRAKYLGCQLFCYYGDLIEKYAFSLEKSASAFDAVFTFDEKQAEIAPLRFLQGPLENIGYSAKEILYDVVFVGEAKQRLELIMDVYRQLKARGFCCKFHIRGVPKEKQAHYGDIVYRGMPYSELLELDKQSHCILEIMQGDDAYSPTTRRAEAMLLGKNLLTNCPALSSSQDPQVIYFQRVSDIDFSRIRRSVRGSIFNWAEYFSARQMIRSIKESIAQGHHEK